MGCRERIYSPTIRLQVQDIGKEKLFYQCWFWVLLKPGFVSVRYIRLGYIHLAFKGRRQANNSLSMSAIKNSLQINTVTGDIYILIIPANGNVVPNTKFSG